MMRLKELSHTTLLMKLNEIFCCGWSEDDKFYVITNNGLDVFHLKPNPESKIEELSFNRSFIFPLQYYPSEHAGFDDSEIEKISREDLSTILYDPLLVPRLKVASDTPLYFIKAIWSTSRIVPSENCALALLTSVGGATLWMYKTNTWSVLVDISNLILLHLKGEDLIVPLTMGTPDYMPKFQEQCYKLVTSAIAWSSFYQFKHENFVFFTTVQKNGDVYVWKVKPDNVLDVTLQAELEVIHESKFKNVCSALWIAISQFRCVLVLGTIRGKVYCVHFDIDTDFKLKYSRTVEVWQDEDNIKVTQMLSTWIGPRICIVVIKASFFIGILINQDGEVVSTSHKHLDNLNITGVQEIDYLEYAVSTMTGVTCTLTLGQNYEDCNLHISDSMVDVDLNYSRWAQYGMCISKKSAIWVSCLNPCKTMQRQFGKSCSRIVFSHPAHLDPMAHIYNNKSELLTNIWDLMELARVLMLKNNKVIPNNWTMEWNHEMTDYQLKVCLWITFMAHLVQEATEKVKKIRELILCRHVERSLPLLVLKQYKEGLSVFEEDSAKCMVNYLRYCNKTFRKGELGPYLERINRSLHPLIPEDSDILCDWCQEPLENVNCSQGHPRQWCCVTLQKVDDGECLVCNVCGCSAHAELVNQSPTCTFCDTYMQSNSLFAKPLAPEDKPVDVAETPVEEMETGASTSAEIDTTK